MIDPTKLDRFIEESIKVNGEWFKSRQTVPVGGKGGEPLNEAGGRSWASGSPAELTEFKEKPGTGVR